MSQGSACPGMWMKRALTLHTLHCSLSVWRGEGPQPQSNLPGGYSFRKFSHVGTGPSMCLGLF